METIREIIEKNPGKTLDLLTSAGYLMATPEVCAGLLRQEPMKMHPGCPGWELKMEVPADMGLAMQVFSMAPEDKDENLLHIMAE